MGFHVLLAKLKRELIDLPNDFFLRGLGRLQITICLFRDGDLGFRQVLMLRGGLLLGSEY